MELDRIVEITQKLDTSGIDWDEAKAAGLSEDERFILTYFADIEGQTIIYLRDLLHTRAVNDAKSVGFLSIWNYEEYFHGMVLSQLLDVCGGPLGDDRIGAVRKNAAPWEKIMPSITSLVSKIWPEEFLTLYLTWGSVQEFTTHAGYKQLRETTNNPVLAELCKRIQRQERVHFSWYYNNAKQRLEASEKGQRFVRRLLNRFWTPVGAGVKSPQEVARLFQTLFPGEASATLARDADAKVAALPGMEGLTIMQDYIDSLRNRGFDTGSPVPA